MVSFSPGIWVRGRRLHDRDRIGGRKSLLQALLERAFEGVERLISPPLGGSVDVLWFRRLWHRASQPLNAPRSSSFADTKIWG
jgi:hypothetical protein